MSRGSTHIAIVYFDAASGHRSSAMALEKAMALAHPQWKIRLVNIVDVFDQHPLFGKIVRTGIQYFNWQLKKDRVFDLKGLIRLSLLCQKLVARKGIQKIASFWHEDAPDVIVSVTPMYNRVLYESVRLVNPEVKCVTIPVDFEEVMPGYWFTPEIEQYYLNATERLAEQVVAAGIPEKYHQRIGGMVVDVDAYKKKAVDKKEAILAMGLDPQVPTGFLSFGGQGCSRVREITSSMSKANLKVNMIILCGKDEQLYQSVSNMPTSFPKKVFSYLPETPIHYLQLADFAIGKPGAMTITEALITDTPLIALKSTGMHPVQSGNEVWMQQTETGIVAKNVEDVTVAIDKILKTDAYKKNIVKHQHHAINETVAFIHALVSL